MIRAYPHIPTSHELTRWEYDKKDGGAQEYNDRGDFDDDSNFDDDQMISDDEDDGMIFLLSQRQQKGKVLNTCYWRIYNNYDDDVDDDDDDDGNDHDDDDGFFYYDDDV